jgi:hypothetical protein
MERAFMNPDKGTACCRWEAPDRESLVSLFESADAPFDQISKVAF